MDRHGEGHGANFSATVNDTSCTFAKARARRDDEDFTLPLQQLDKMIAPNRRTSCGRPWRRRHRLSPSASLASCAAARSALGGAENIATRAGSEWCVVQPTLEFLGFDVAVAERGAAAWRFLDFDDARKAAEAAGFLRLPLARELGGVFDFLRRVHSAGATRPPAPRERRTGRRASSSAARERRRRRRRQRQAARARCSSARLTNSPSRSTPTRRGGTQRRRRRRRARARRARAI